MKTNVQLFNTLRKFKTVQICGTKMEELAEKLGLKGGKLLEKRVVRSKGGISTDIRFCPSLLFCQRFLFLLRRLTYNRTKTQAATLHECHCTTSAMLQVL